LPLPQNSSTSDLGGVSRKNRYDQNARQGAKHIFEANARFVRPQKSPSECSRLWFGIASNLHCTAAPLAVIRFGKVRQLEVHRESLGKFGSFTDRDSVNQIERGPEARLVGTAGDRQRPESLDRIEESLSFLLSNHVSQQASK
jgi:hypothetical protein